MTELLLHVGMDKTGSSSIQQSFANYDDGKMAYAKLASVNHSFPIQVLFRAPDNPTQGLKLQGVTPEKILEQRGQHRADIEAALDGSRERVLMSAEGVLGLNAEQLAEFHAYISPLCERIKVLAYVREPMGYASSAFQQGLKSGQTIFHVPMPRYTKRLGMLDDVFGAENVTFLRFDSKSFPNKSVTQDFAARIGADMALVDERRSNESMSAEAAAALFLFNRERADLVGTPALFQARIMMVRLLMGVPNNPVKWVAKRMEARLGLKPGTLISPEEPPEKFRFTPSLVRSHIPARDVKWMEERTGFDLMPPDVSATDEPESGIRSEEHLLEIASTAGNYIAPILARLKLTPKDASTLSMMDALFAHTLERCS